MKRIKTLPGFALCSFLLVMLLYINTFQHAYNLDDVFLLNHLPPQGSSFDEIFSVFDQIYDEADYRPLGSLILAVEQWVFGEADAGVSHVVNALLYWIGCVLLFWSVRLFLKDKQSHIPVLVTLLFIALPIHSNVVASIKNRDILISFIFGMLALNAILVLMNRRFTTKPIDLIASIALILVALGAFLFGSLAKQDIISFAFVIPLAIFTRMHSRTRKVLLARYGLLFALPPVLFYIFKKFRFDYIRGEVIVAPAVDNTIAITENPLIMDPSIQSKVGVALTSVFYYLKFNVFPSGYYFYFGYDHVPTGTLFHPYNIIAIIAMVLAAWLFFRNLKDTPLLSFGIGFFFLSIIYALNIYMPVAGIVAPRLGFISSAGYAIVLCYAILFLAQRFNAVRAGSRYSVQKLALVLVTGFFLFYGSFTVDRNRAWKDISTLLKTDMPHLERSFEAQRIATGTYYNLIQQTNNPGVREARIDQSLKHARLAHAVYDGDQYIEETLGLTLFYKGDLVNSYKQLYTVVERFPTSVSAWQIMGEINMAKKDYRGAARCFIELSNLQPDNPSPFIKATQNMIQVGEINAAIEFNRKNIAKDSSAYFHYEGVGYALLVAGDTTAAVPYFFYAQDHQSPNKQYRDVFEDYYRRNGQLEEWFKLQAGYRPDLGL